MQSDRYYYEPGQGHGLPHDPFNAIVGPRPIGWISSQDAEGRLNLAPYSFFNAFNYMPPIIGFSRSSGSSDLRRDLRRAPIPSNRLKRNEPFSALPEVIHEYRSARQTP